MGPISAFRNEPAAKKAWLASIFLAFILQFLNLSTEITFFDLMSLAIRLGVAALYMGYIFYCLVVIRGGSKNSSKAPFHEISIGVRGYFWRGVLVYLMSLLSTMIILLVLRADPPTGFSVVWNLYFLALALFIVPSLCWLFFSEDRKAQFNWVVGVFRGY
ncbi:MAG: hypothetical protein ACRBBM_01410 [Pseudomonadaceae bacterium]